MHARVTPKRPNRRRRRRLSRTRTRTPRLCPSPIRENQNTQISLVLFTIGRLPPTPPTKPKRLHDDEKWRRLQCAALVRAHVDGDGEKRDTEARIEEHTHVVTMGVAYDASLAREVVNECTTSANVRRVVAHAIEGVTRALGGAALTARMRCQSLARYMCWSVMNTTLIFEN